MSQQHLLQVDFLPTTALSLPGRLGLTIAPGKRLADNPPEQQRDLSKDLAHLRDFYQTHLLVSLIQAEEMALLRIPNLLTQVVHQGMVSAWFPIVDFGCPAVIADFATLIRQILTTIAAGKTVVVHCRAGRGRSGLVAAACLIATGYGPEEAIAIVRRTRPGSVETWEQAAYLREFASSLLSPTPPKGLTD